MEVMKRDVYKVWKIKKRRGGFRSIESPNDELKVLQRESVNRLSGAIKVSPFAHGFQPYKNIVTMAMPHIKKDFVGSIDISDYFPSIKQDDFEKRLKPDLKDVDQADIDVHFHDFGDKKGKRLPQGAPGSPFLSNAYLLSFDWRMAWLCARDDINYTRYADDLTFSGADRDKIVVMIGVATRILSKEYKLIINKKKTKIMPKTRRQLCCGIVVNEKLNLKRETRKNLRAEVHQKAMKGDLPLDTLGRLSFEKMVRENIKTTHSSMEIIGAIKIKRALHGKEQRRK